MQLQFTKPNFTGKFGLFVLCKHYYPTFNFPKSTGSDTWYRAQLNSLARIASKQRSPVNRFAVLLSKNWTNTIIRVERLLSEVRGTIIRAYYNARVQDSKEKEL